MTPQPADALMIIGVVRKPHGIRGELALTLTVDDLSLLSGTVFLQSPASALAGRKGGSPAAPPTARPTGRDARPCTVAGVRMHHGAALLLLREVTDRNAAESLRGFSVSIPRSRLPELAEDEIFLSDLLGLRVVMPASPAEAGSVGGEGGGVGGEGDGDAPAERAERELGVITSVDEPNGQILWTITTPEGREILFPAVEAFVLGIDPDEGVAVVDPPPGLLAVYLDE